jgi:hypothetical protein
VLPPTVTSVLHRGLFSTSTLLSRRKLLLRHSGYTQPAGKGSAYLLHSWDSLAALGG